MKKASGIFISILVLGFLIWIVSSFFKSRDPTEITYWDFWDENSIRPVLAEFERTHPKVKISYVTQSPLNYRARLSTKIKEESGPDVFPVRNSWVGVFTKDLSTAPSGIFNSTDFKKTFYPVAAESFIMSNQVFAAPLEIDGLALFVNEDIITAGGVATPKSWQEFITSAIKLTVKDSEGVVKTAGAALGTTSNIDYWSDILGLMLLQQGVDFKNLPSKDGAEVLAFYTGFVTDPTKKVWDVNLPPSTKMFIEGKLVFYFAPYSKVAQIKASNPNLKFKVIPAPQLPGREIAWASFWGEAVSGKSKHQSEAWQFVQFLTSKEVAKNFALAYGRVDLASLQNEDPTVGAFVSQGPYYKFWYLSSEPPDQGINDEMIKVWEDGVNKVLQGQTLEVAMQNISKGTKQVLDKYKIK